MALTKVSRGLLSTGIVDNSTTTAITIDSSENVGIGQAPSAFSNWKILELKGGTAGAMLNFENSSSTRVSSLAYDDGSDSLRIQNFLANPITFETSNTERMRIDSSGNLLVGHSGTADSVVDNGGQGVSIRPTDVLIGSTGACLYLNREDSDGVLAAFRKDGTNVGSIGSIAGGYLSISGTTGGRLQINGTDEYAWDTTQFYPANDNANDLGFITKRWDDIYATNGTIQTSDRNEKQDIEALSDAEQRVAVAAKGLMRKFRWIDAVEAKGDDARIHFGIIAQDLQAAFEAEGLDAARYAMFTSNTWWETQTEVAAVEAVEATEDTEAIEAVDAYTRTDTYDTAEEAPEGATERTRLGIRYSELLAFIISAI